mgnify:CR=1 FL=1
MLRFVSQRTDIPKEEGHCLWFECYSLNRLWVVPHSEPSAQGAYLRYPLDDMLRILAITLVLLPLAACETAKGFGKDVESLGRNIQDEVE